MPTAFSEGGWAGKGQGISCTLDGKLPLKAYEPQVGQWHEEVERKREYYHNIIFIKGL